ncbi:hypothetical protein V8C34DRAFT_274626 [Trichoderma compactum]
MGPLRDWRRRVGPGWFLFSCLLFLCYFSHLRPGASCTVTQPTYRSCSVSGAVKRNARLCMASSIVSPPSSHIAERRSWAAKPENRIQEGLNDTDHSEALVALDSSHFCSSFAFISSSSSYGLLWPGGGMFMRVGFQSSYASFS